MAETKTSISELTAAATVGANDLLFVSQLSGGSYFSRKAAVSQLPFGQGTITSITMNGASKGTSGNVDLGTVLTAHQSLANYYMKSETSSATEYWVAPAVTASGTFTCPSILPDTRGMNNIPTGWTKVDK